MSGEVLSFRTARRALVAHASRCTCVCVCGGGVVVARCVFVCDCACGAVCVRVRVFSARNHSCVACVCIRARSVRRTLAR
eukprot:6863550-Alexandrium_andersonii.AAC.1